MQAAVRSGRLKETEMLLKKGASPYSTNGPSRVIHEVGLSAQVNEMVPLLMKYGVDCQTRDAFGWNLMFYLAVNSGTEDVAIDLAKELIEKGVSPCEIRNDVSQPIHMCIWNNKPRLLSLYLDHGADVNAREGFNVFPLYTAVNHCDDPALMLTLLKRGANIDLKTDGGLTALHGLIVNRSIGELSEENSLKKLKILLTLGADMFAVSNSGLTPFESIRSRDMDNPSIKLILKTLALKRARLEPSKTLEEEKFFIEYPELSTYYNNCVEEINKMKSTKFICIGTLYEILTKCPCQMLGSMRYCIFRSRFSTYGISEFPLFAEDLRESFNKATNHYNSVLDQEDLLNEVYYYRLSHLIVRKLAVYNLDCEICEIKKNCERG
ncbi:putative ankyrin repeat protein RF_0381 [Nasonia vitripennis]|uniref:Ankyrin repeat protein n=1 Tax=Nasonia vitripennis TaxID=7425 RepID=A0A7M7M7A9_NASVI|nr:putative ankyrin repeat protein RF_0381 [Nasonia vitripennis]